VGPGLGVCASCVSYLQCDSNFCDANGYCNVRNCQSSADCGGQPCNTLTGQCDCGLLNICALCGSNSDCASGLCDANHHCNVSDCGTSNACSAVSAACEADAGDCNCGFDGGFCYVCYSNLDCAPGLQCWGGYCVSLPCGASSCIADGEACMDDGGPCNCLPN
jgi:hypothetical protein